MNFNDFLASIFEIFGFYSTSNGGINPPGLGEHLLGLTIECAPPSGGLSIYFIVFLCIVTLNTIIILNYYYGFFNRVKFTNLLTWFLNIMISSGIIFLIAYLYANNDFETKNYCQTLTITKSDCVGFGLSAFIYAIIWSLIISFIIKWKSSNNKKVPF